jgi:hypothetical protein
VPEIGRWLIVAGVIAIVAGAALVWGPRLPWLGRLPGDFVFRRGPLTVYVPLATSLLVSVLLTLLLLFIGRR